MMRESLTLEDLKSHLSSLPKSVNPVKLIDRKKYFPDVSVENGFMHRRSYRNGCLPDLSARNDGPHARVDPHLSKMAYSFFLLHSFNEFLDFALQFLRMKWE